MSPTELKMQPTIHLQSLRGYLLIDLKNVKHSLLYSFVNFYINVIRLVKCQL
jgi:hypothetical protein